MRQRLHLLVVNCAQRTAHAARYGRRWLLPVIDCGEMVRAGPLVARWCAERDVATDVAGQWLGRVDDESVDWLMTVPAHPNARTDATSLEWISLDALANGMAVVDYQGWALRRSLERAALPSVDGPFGTLDWPERVRSWLENTLAVTPLAWTPLRISAYEVVAGCETPRGRVYFKGLAADRLHEPIVTQRFAAIAPESFARTLAFEHGEDGTAWWLTAECRGRPADDPVRVAIALARLQCRLQSVAHESPHLPRTDISRDEFTHLPQSWMPMDLDPSNVLIDGGEVRFIDLDDSFIGPAPQAMAAFARRCSRDTAAAYRAYEQSWSPPLEGLDWRGLEDAAITCQSQLGWIRLMRNVERGELTADLDALRNRVETRLARRLQRG